MYRSRFKERIRDMRLLREGEGCKSGGDFGDAGSNKGQRPTKRKSALGVAVCGPLGSLADRGKKTRECR
jgi:hypothetical protein